MILLLTAFNVGRSFYLDAFPKATGKAAGAAVFDQVLNFLRLSARTVGAVGVVVAIGAWLAGPSPSATRVRALVSRTDEAPTESSAFARWVARHLTGLRATVIAGAGVGLVAVEHPTALTVLVLFVVTLALLAAVEFVARTGAAPLATVETAKTSL